MLALDTIENADATAVPVRWRIGDAKELAKTLAEALSERISASWTVSGSDEIGKESGRGKRVHGSCTIDMTSSCSKARQRDKLRTKHGN
jgi:hypothetical protein